MARKRAIQSGSAVRNVPSKFSRLTKSTPVIFDRYRAAVKPRHCL